MKGKLLVTTAMLVASVAIASAQTAPGAPEQKKQGNAVQEHSQAQTPARAGAEKAQQEERQGQTPRGQAQGQRSQTTGQAPQTQREQGEPGQAQQRNEREGTRANGQREQKNDGRENRAPGEREQNQAQQPNQRGNQTGQRAGEHEGDQAQRPGEREGNQTGQNQRGENQREGNQREGREGTGREGTVQLSTEQRDRFRTTLSSARDIPRVDSVNFALNVGIEVPGYVNIAVLPEPIIEMYPAWRGDSYFVVQDQVVIVDNAHHIVARVPFEGSNAAFENRGGINSGQGVAFSGGPAEIREIQIALVREGYNIGEPDGVMGARTREALIAFQRQRGFQATGQIDERTMTELRVNERGRETTGQGGRPGENGRDNGHPDNARDNARPDNDRDNVRQPRNQPGNSTNNPGARDREGNLDRNRPATTGQGNLRNERTQPGNTTGQGNLREEKGNSPANTLQDREGSRLKGEEQK